MPTPCKWVGIFTSMLNLEQFNLDVQAWGTSAATQMQATGQSMGIQHRDGSPSPRASLASIVARFKMAAGIVHIVSFRVPRALIYVHKGAGKGMGGSKGSSWADRYGQQHRTNPKSLGKMGTGSRQEKPFFNHTMQQPDGMDRLGDIVVTSLGDAITNNLLIN